MSVPGNGRGWPAAPGDVSLTRDLEARPPDWPLHFIDLFCGCGGLTLGMLRAGLQCAAAVDSDPAAIATLRANLCDHKHPDLPIVQHAIHRDLTQFSPGALSEMTGLRHVDVIVGGPPCQGFSTARQVDGANHGSRLTPDPRRQLYRQLLRHVEFFEPFVFVMENVPGLRSAAAGEYFTRVQKEARELGLHAGRPGYRVHTRMEDSWQLGVPQKRRRQLIIGVRNDVPGYFPALLGPAPRATPRITLGAALGDLPILRAGSGQHERTYDRNRRSRHLRTASDAERRYLLEVLDVRRARRLVNHVARPHSTRDLRDFALLREGENSATAMRLRGVSFEFPYDKSTFKDRYTRQNRKGPCSTIVAHLAKDGLMFIHPTQLRSLTPREAARIQSFPDWFVFPEARAPAFRQIGNAVPPLVGEALGLAIIAFLEPGKHAWNRGAGRGEIGGSPAEARMVSGYEEAVRALGDLVLLDSRSLRMVPNEHFLRGWHALLLLLPRLHPDNALDHGEKKEVWPDGRRVLPALDGARHLRYSRSGWPVALELIGREAWRRHRAGALDVDGMYPAPPVVAERY